MKRKPKPTVSWFSFLILHLQTASLYTSNTLTTHTQWERRQTSDNV